MIEVICNQPRSPSPATHTVGLIIHMSLLSADRGYPVQLARPRPFLSLVAEWFVPALLAVGCVAYVYRLPVGIGNVSLFRIGGLVAGLSIVLKMLTGPPIVTRRVLLRVSLPACIAGAITFPALYDVTLRSIPSGYVPDAVVQTINIAVFLVLVAYIDNRTVLNRVVKAYIAVSFVEAGFALGALATGHLLFESWVMAHGAEFYSELSLVNQSGGLRRLTGTFYDPNFYGVYLCTVIGVSTWVLASGTRSRLAVSAIPLSIVLIILTASRTAMVGLVVLAITIVVVEPRSRRFVGWLAAFVAPVIVCVAYVLIENPLLERILSGQSMGDRLEFFARGLEAFSQSPYFGEGSVALIDPDSGFSTAHSVYISVLGKFGLFGGIAYAAFIFAPVVLWQRSELVARDKNLSPLLVLPLAAMYLAYDFFQFLEFQFAVYAISYAAVLLPAMPPSNRR